MTGKNDYPAFSTAPGTRRQEAPIRELALDRTDVADLALGGSGGAAEGGAGAGPRQRSAGSVLRDLAALARVAKRITGELKLTVNGETIEARELLIESPVTGASIELALFLGDLREKALDAYDLVAEQVSELVELDVRGRTGGGSW